MDRRAFLTSAGAVGVSLGLPAVSLSQSIPARSRRATGIYFDASGGITASDPAASGELRLEQRAIDLIRQRRLDIVSTTIGPVGNGPDRFRLSVESIAGWDRRIAKNSGFLMKIETAGDIKTAVETGRAGIIYNFQDTAALEGEASRVETFWALGVRQLQLTYNLRNLAGDGCLEPANGGLSNFGRDVIAQINASKILLDLSHAGQRTIAEGLAVSTAPSAISHTGCRDLVDLPRNTYDAEMRALASRGGVVGIYLMPFLRKAGQPGREDLIRHIEHAVKICGEDHVGIGTDNLAPGTDTSPEARTVFRQVVEERRRRGISAPGEDPEVLLYVEGYNSPDRFDRIGSDLRRRGWSSTRIEKVLGMNWVRLYRQVWEG